MPCPMEFGAYRLVGVVASARCSFYVSSGCGNTFGYLFDFISHIWQHSLGGRPQRHHGFWALCCHIQANFYVMCDFLAGFGLIIFCRSLHANRYADINPKRESVAKLTNELSNQWDVEKLLDEQCPLLHGLEAQKCLVLHE